MRARCRLGIGRWLLAATLIAAAAADDAIIAPLAGQSLLLDVAAAGDALVAVGERGHILRSVDQGTTWRQQPAPTRATLTAVAFFDDLHGYAVGHDAVILRTDDGGATWRLVFSAPEEERPLLDIHLKDAGAAVAIGAYGYYLESADDGEHWESRLFKAVDPGEPETESEKQDEFGDDFHLNRIAVAETGRWYIAGEAGSIYRSDDAGGRWVRLESPYEGSFFGVLPLDGDGLLLFGLQGRLYHSNDAGDNWRRVETHTNATLTAAARLADGGVIIVGHAGVILVDREGDGEFVLQHGAQRAGISAVVVSPPGAVVAVGEDGARLLLDAELGND